MSTEATSINVSSTQLAASKAISGRGKEILLGTKWLKVWSYFFLPLSGVLNIIASFPKADYASVFLTLAVAILQFVTSFGLYNRKLWAWKMNWIAIIVAYINSITAPTFIKQSYGYEESTVQFFLRIILFIIIWIWPNYIYWKKRMELFS